MKKTIFLKNLDFRRFFRSFPFVAFFSGIAILALMCLFPSFFNFIKLEDFSIRVQYFNTILGLLGGLFVLTFSISLISLQISASKFSTMVLRRYFRDKAVSALLIFFVFSIISCLTSYFSSAIFLEEAAFILAIISLILVVSQFYLVWKYADPIEITKQIIDEIKNAKKPNQIFERKNIERLVEIYYIAIKAEEGDAKEILKMLSDFRREVSLPTAKDFINGYIASSGKYFAQKGSDLSLDATYNLINFENKEISRLEDKSHVINYAIMHARGVLQEIIKNVRNIDLHKVALVQTQLYLLYEILFKINEKHLNIVNEYQVRHFLDEFSTEMTKLETIESRKNFILLEYKQNKESIEHLSIKRRAQAEKNEK